MLLCPVCYAVLHYVQSAVEEGRDDEHCTPLASCVAVFNQTAITGASSIDLIFHPTTLTVAAPTLRFGGLINVISYKATLSVHA